MTDEYMLNEGADPAAIGRAIQGLSEWLPSERIDRRLLGIALGRTKASC